MTKYQRTKNPRLCALVAYIAGGTSHHQPMGVGHMTVLQLRGPMGFRVLQWCHPMLVLAKRTSYCTWMITLYGTRKWIQARTIGMALIFIDFPTNYVVTSSSTFYWKTCNYQNHLKSSNIVQITLVYLCNLIIDTHFLIVFLFVFSYSTIMKQSQKLLIVSHLSEFYSQVYWTSRQPSRYQVYSGMSC